MSRLLVLVEGQSEEAFVNRILCPHLAPRGVFATPRILETRRLPGRSADKGGVISWEKVKRDLRHLLGDTDAWTTTLFDLYGLPADFPGVAASKEPKGAPATSRVEAIETAFSKVLGSPRRFIPFLALHEFEAWIFTGPLQVAEHFGAPHLQSQLAQVVARFGSAEEINHGRETHPSRRLELLVDTYKKVSDGPIILERIGLGHLRSHCHHLDQWMARLEAIPV